MHQALHADDGHPVKQLRCIQHSYLALLERIEGPSDCAPRSVKTGSLTAFLLSNVPTRAPTLADLMLCLGADYCSGFNSGADTIVLRGLRAQRAPGSCVVQLEPNLACRNAFYHV